MKDLVRVFNGEKYLKWKMDLTMYLMANSLGHLLTSIDDESEEEDKEVETEAKETKAKEKTTQREKDQRIVSHIYFCVSSTYQLIVLDCDTVVELLDKFDSMFLVVDKLQANKLREQLAAFKIDHSKTFSE